jgi:hypothetical protein
MKLYTLNGAHEIESVEVLRETPKRYYAGSHKFLYGAKFVKKDDTTWFPEPVMAIQWMREILKKRILMIDEEIYRQKQKAAKALVDLNVFDKMHGVVDADPHSEESYWMKLQREG